MRLDSVKYVRTQTESEITLTKGAFLIDEKGGISTVALYLCFDAQKALGRLRLKEREREKTIYTEA